jgi:gliding motility-associated-like protein
MNELNNILRDKLQNYKPEAPKSVLSNVKSYYPKNKSFIPREIIITTSIISIFVLTYFVLNNYLNKEKYLELTIAEQNISENYHHNSKETTLGIINDNTQNKAIFRSNQTKKLEEHNKQVDYIRKKENIFEHNSITVCGNYYLLPLKLDFNKLVLPEFLQLKEDKDGNINLYSEKGGFYDIVYQSITDKTIYADTMHIVFISHPVPDYKILEDIKCPEDVLLVYLKTDEDIKLYWDTDNGIITDNQDYTYSIKWLDSGKKSPQIITETPDCHYVTEFDVFIPEPIEYGYTSTSSYCNSNNGSITIKNINYFDSEISLDNKKSLTGEFKNLSSGNYTLNINYNSSCLHQEKIIIYDSLSIKSDFDFRRDFSNTNRISFINNTKLDNEAYQFNPEINFSWYIDNIVFSDSDNPTYEFIESGEYEISLKAYYDSKCYDIYSEIITIEGEELLIPNIFTPNDDGIDDVFIVNSTETLKSFHGIISSRTGELVFEWKNIKEGWDGRIKGINKASEGVYFYLIRAETANGKILEKKGTVQLVRE